MKQYLELLKRIKSEGVLKPAARKGMPGTLSIFGHQMTFNLREGFPLVTTKGVNFKNIVIELKWFLSGDTNIGYLVDNGVNIWNGDAYNYYKKVASQSFDQGAEEIMDKKEFNEAVKNPANRENNLFGDSSYILGDCGHQYGKVWRDWKTNEDDHRGTVDQIKRVIESLRTNPEGRRHVVTAVDPANDDDLALYWCHSMFQFNARPLGSFERAKIEGIEFDEYTETAFKRGAKQDNIEEVMQDYFDSIKTTKYYLDCHMYQRSADVILGVPYNIASYALLTHIVAKLTGMKVGNFIHSFGDVHVYENHLEAMKEQLEREPKELPNLHWNTEASFENLPIDLDDFLLAFEYDDLHLSNYNPHPAIKAELSTGD